MNKNILREIKENKVKNDILSTTKFVEILCFNIYNGQKGIINTLITNDSDDMIYKKLLYESQLSYDRLSMFQSFFYEYIRYIDERDKNKFSLNDRILTNYGNDKIKSIFINNYQNEINDMFNNPSIFIQDENFFYVDIIIYINIYKNDYSNREKYQDMFLNFKNKVKNIVYELDYENLKKILDNDIYRIKIQKLSDKINNYSIYFLLERGLWDER